MLKRLSRYLGIMKTFDQTSFSFKWNTIRLEMKIIPFERIFMSTI